MTHPEENMAIRVLQRHGLTPPFDLEALVASYANIEKRTFPTDADGISIGIDGASKPEIIINTNHYPTRQKFTLAHELGHIIIPWHTGTIISHTQMHAYDDVMWEYREMETEANRFAAELLMPSEWILAAYNKSKTIAAFIKKILDESGASQDAAFIKIFNTIEDNIILAEVNNNFEIIKSYKTKNTPMADIPVDTNLLASPPFNSAQLIDNFALKSRNYLAWKFMIDTVPDLDQREWREILSQIMIDCGIKSLQASINAVLPAAFQKNKTKPRDEIILRAVMAYEGNNKFSSFVRHPLFRQYVAKRIDELIRKAPALA